MCGEATDIIAEQREKRCLGFKHLVREGFVTRSNLSRPTDDKWSESLAPPTIGAIMDGNQKDVIAWTVEEDNRNVGEDQSDHCIIRSIDCDGKELTGTNKLCSCYFRLKQILFSSTRICG